MRARDALEFAMHDTSDALGADQLYPSDAGRILDNLPEGWFLADPQDEQQWYERGYVRAAQERLELGQEDTDAP